MDRPAVSANTEALQNRGWQFANSRLEQTPGTITQGNTICVCVRARMRASVFVYVSVCNNVKMNRQTLKNVVF